jgi:cytochrome c oxidase cbb3-type subunit III
MRRRIRLRLHRGPLVILLAAAIADCKQESAEQATEREGARQAVLPVGELQAGPPVERPLMRNPLEHESNAVAEGSRIFAWFNCAGCHGVKGGGGIGPPLRDPQWIYGSDPASIFQTLAQGRPNGMPAFSGRMSDQQIWRLERYIRSLGGAEENVAAGGSSGKSPTQRQQGR